MVKKIYSIRDAKGGVYNQPFQALNEQDAVRSFTRVAWDKNSMINAFPNDFDLYYLGEFDDTKGLYSPIDTPQHVVKAVDLPPQPQ